MTAGLASLLKWLESDFSVASPIDEQRILESRDAPPFDEDWIRANRSVEERLTQSILEADDQQSIDKIREIAFKKVFEATGSHELSACVSDDLGLVAKAIASGAEIPLFVEHLRDEYISGRIAS